MSDAGGSGSDAPKKSCLRGMCMHNIRPLAPDQCEQLHQSFGVARRQVERGHHFGKALRLYASIQGIVQHRSLFRAFGADHKLLPVTGSIQTGA